MYSLRCIYIIFKLFNIWNHFTCVINLFPVLLMQWSNVCVVHVEGSPTAMTIICISKTPKQAMLPIRCPVSHFWSALKLQSLPWFTRSNYPILLLSTLPLPRSGLGKDLGRVNTLKLVVTWASKSNIISRLAEFLNKSAHILSIIYFFI